MSFKNFSQALTFKAGANFSATQFHIVELTATAHEVDLAAVGSLPVGVVQNHPNSGEAAAVVLSGISKCIAGGAVAAGKLVSAAATGFATQTISGGIEIAVFGRALTTAASGGIFTLLIAPTVTVSGDAN